MLFYYWLSLLQFLPNNVSYLDQIFLIRNSINSSSFPAYYIQQCKKSDPNVDQCLKASANKFARYVQKGIPELEIEEVGEEKHSCQKI